MTSKDVVGILIKISQKKYWEDGVKFTDSKTGKQYDITELIDILMEDLELLERYKENEQDKYC